MTFACILVVTDCQVIAGQYNKQLIECFVKQRKKGLIHYLSPTLPSLAVKNESCMNDLS